MRHVAIVAIAILLASCGETEEQIWERERVLVKVCASGHTVWLWRDQHYIAWYSRGVDRKKVVGPESCT